MFGIVEQMVFKPARASTHPGVYHAGAVQIPDFETLAADLPSGVVALATHEPNVGLLQVPGRAERATVWRVSGGYADVFGVRPQAGRWINHDDNLSGEVDPKREVNGSRYPIVLGQLGADVVVISDRIWREWFRASRDVVGTGTLLVDHRPMRIVGVAPAAFETSIDAWMPFGARRLLTREELEDARHRKPFPGWRGPVPEPRQPTLRTVIRKESGASLAEVNDRLTAAVKARIATPEMPATRFDIQPDRVDGRLLRTGYVVLGFAALIFVAACANLANMVYARAIDREGELAVRLALGAGRFHVARLLIAEPFLISAAATATGLLLAAGALRLFTNVFPAFQVSYWESIRVDLILDWRIVACASIAGLLAAVVVSIGSLRRSSRVPLLARIAAGGPAVVAKTEARSLRTFLVAVQISAAVLLLTATGMLLENTSKRLNRRLLFDTGQLVTATIELPAAYDESRGRHFFAQLLERVRALDGVTSAALTDALPGGEGPWPRSGVSSISVEAPDRGFSAVPKRIDGHWIHVSPGLLDTIGLRLIRGRDLLPTDDTGSEPVAVVTVSTAAHFWPGKDALNQRVLCCGSRQPRRVVGVVADPIGTNTVPLSLDLGEAIAAAGTSSDAGAYVVLPAAQQFSRTMLIVAKSAAPEALTDRLREAIAALDPGVPVFNAGLAGTTQFGQWRAEQSVRLLAGVLGTLSLTIAVLGVFAVVSYFVSRRTREFGLRLALGSTRGQILRLVIDHGIHMVLIGLLPAVLLASLGTRVLQVELVRLHPNGIMVWVAVPLIMLAAGVLAAYVPARRASRVEPNRTLKEL